MYVNDGMIAHQLPQHKHTYSRIYNNFIIELMFPLNTEELNQISNFIINKTNETMESIGRYRENAIAIESEAKYPFGGNVYYVTMQITLHIPEFARKECNLSTLPPHGSLDSFWIKRSQRSRRRDKDL